MKDRTPKYRGRVKLLPVAGQENIYDMTRADEPDDTGTPFNKRTMLQDSTANFLQLNVANPFVDDALRQMPDRINPIGTIRTTPQESLGAAWLKCDGSQVTFSNYPELCSILHTTAEDVKLDVSVYGDAGDFVNVSNIVKFKGKYYFSGAKYTEETDGKYLVVKIMVADEPSGQYTLAKEIKEYRTQDISDSGRCATGIVCSEEMMLIVTDASAGNPYSWTDYEGIHFAYTDDGQTWKSYNLLMKAYDIAVTNARYKGGKCLATNGDTWAIAIGKTLLTTKTPKNKDSWEKYTVNLTSNINTNIFFENEVWIFTSFDNTSTYIAWTTDINGNWENTTINKTTGDTNLSVEIVYYAGVYWTILGREISMLYKSANLAEWESIIISQENQKYKKITGGNQIVITKEKEGIASATPQISGSFTSMSLPDGETQPIQTIEMFGNIFVAVASGRIYYHDYSADIRLLPSISLSNDTNTFIKAKREIDVFEAAENGGDAS